MKSSIDKGPPVVLWSCIARNETILVEAGEDTSDRSVSTTAKELLDRDPTPGWEFHTQSKRSYLLQRSSGSNIASSRDRRRLTFPPITRRTGTSTSTDNLHQRKAPRLKGIKFHVYEKDMNNEYIIWVFACVYDPNNIGKNIVQAFLTKLVSDTEHLRDKEFEWLYGPNLACQDSFGPLLRHYMMQISHLAKYTTIEKQVEDAKEHMSRNIELLLMNEPKIEDLNQQATQLQEMASVFQKKAKTVQRVKMWHNAKHGFVVGTAITAGVAIVTIPPLVALL